MLDMATREIDSKDLNIYNDLKKLVNSKKFLEITKLDLSTFAISNDVLFLLTQSCFVCNLEVLDISNSMISDIDLQIIGKDSNKQLQNLISLYLDNCNVTAEGVNCFTGLKRLKFLSLKCVEIVIENLTLYTLVDIVFTRLFNHTIKKEIIGNSPVKGG